jgi:quercetin dioxygenase-like cupin family protein
MDAKMQHVDAAKPVENPPGVVRKTLAYSEEAMLCHFTLKKDARIPLHNHRATQIGYVVRGKVRFIAENAADEFEGWAGSSYVFSAYVKHGAVALEETEYVETFVPARDEYKDF